MAEIVPIEQGQMTIAAVRADPDAGAAPRSAPARVSVSMFDADVVVHGHTHVPLVNRADNSWCSTPVRLARVANV